MRKNERKQQLWQAEIVRKKKIVATISQCIKNQLKK
eukprot:UN32828